MICCYTAIQQEKRFSITAVDFVVSRGSKTWAIEVKGGRAGKLSGIDRFRSKCPEAKVLIVGSGGIPLEQFFMSDAGVWFEKSETVAFS